MPQINPQIPSADHRTCLQLPHKSCRSSLNASYYPSNVQYWHNHILPHTTPVGKMCCWAGRWEIQYPLDNVPERIGWGFGVVTMAKWKNEYSPFLTIRIHLAVKNKVFFMKRIKNTPFGFFAETCAIICLELMNIWMHLVKGTRDLHQILQKMTISIIYKYMDRAQSQIQIHVSKVLRIIFHMSGRSLFLLFSFRNSVHSKLTC